MTKLSADLSGQDLIKALKRVGFVIQRQRGSHIILRRESPHARVVVPNHKSIRMEPFVPSFHEANLTIDQLLELL
jgi:predicted RNA binding protein YcfA (HicA-like mRNA interferase family)